MASEHDKQTSVGQRQLKVPRAGDKQINKTEELLRGHR